MYSEEKLWLITKYGNLRVTRFELHRNLWCTKQVRHCWEGMPISQQGESGLGHKVATKNHLPSEGFDHPTDNIHRTAIFLCCHRQNSRSRKIKRMASALPRKVNCSPWTDSGSLFLPGKLLTNNATFKLQVYYYFSHTVPSSPLNMQDQ